LLASVDDRSSDGAAPEPTGAALCPNPDVLASIMAMATIVIVRMFFPGDPARTRGY